MRKTYFPRAALARRLNRLYADFDDARYDYLVAIQHEPDYRRQGKLEDREAVLAEVQRLLREAFELLDTFPRLS